ncbi:MULTISPECIES: hypothetical protein [Rodentibacter]|nr:MULTISPECIES: hypothetical protein [Pasteurellaceae]MCR1838320.1 hypothetical protein [Pasteurella caecimuris]MCU0107569.1 hypothetical protein [Pasteurella caecimuris]NBH76252.1 hypothetical protein [Rodentibacter pneumotropicus]TGY49604.1 hypothetical protein E5343_06360 [Pasteurella caecimuris]THA07163.1 hypothetical protein D3M73_03120 [Rodentibacter pneumotropicus]
MENRITELENKISYLEDQITAHQIVLALLLRPTRSGNIRDDVQNFVNMLSASSDQECEKAKLQIHLERLLKVVDEQFLE